MKFANSALLKVLGILLLVALGLAGCTSGFSEPEKTTSSYEVLEPEIWIGKELPIIEHIDIAETLRKGTWLVLLYHYDCPGCGAAIPKYEQMARELAGNEDFLRIALIALPPYSRGPISENCPCTLGKLDQTKKWFVTSPATALLTDGQVTSAWEEKAPDFDEVMRSLLGG